MHCPFCRHTDSRVIDSREHDDGTAIRRRRACPECGRRFTTVETAALSVVKRSGATEPFSRAKVADGVRKACSGRPVGEDALALLAQQVEEAVRSTGCAEVPAHQIGLAILGPLRDLDEVAYMRFASVYRSFSSLADFEAEIADLRDHQGAYAAPDDASEVLRYGGAPGARSVRGPLSPPQPAARPRGRRRTIGAGRTKPRPTPHDDPNWPGFRGRSAAR